MGRDPSDVSIHSGFHTRHEISVLYLRGGELEEVCVSDGYLHTDGMCAHRINVALGSWSWRPGDFSFGGCSVLFFLLFWVSFVETVSAVESKTL